MVEVASERNSTLVMPVPVELLRFFERMAPAAAGPPPADAGDAEVAEAEAAIEGQLPTAGPPEAIPTVEAVDMPPEQAPDIKVPEINADGEQAERR